MDRRDLFGRTTRNRLLLADVLDGLTPAQWEADTLCEGWTVRDLAGHLLQPMLVGFGRFLLVALRHRGDTDATVDAVARRLARREPDELVRLLRSHAGDEVDPPRVGPVGPFADTCIHLRDLARPLGLEADVPREDWVAVLDHLTGPAPTPGLLSGSRLSDVSLRATDAEWRWGDGAEVVGTLEALTLGVTGRAVVLDELTGPGVDALRR
ncbi:maleylpyruvate isomerase family mycothiol-dependent enzyme [Phycicoccus sonneratiae]|uniref:Maleylpyruvate isomerase family mycothiol-dependent enzyme n=1 Tax=Phycicoccus sonneratiae TaxID=2807628 RepID=A0ABS2CMT5_9MICO|nr:maleylpyruvate isomerase family mycothiol-dependent enzyme [Phycicoccus sonneraticus]MBM6401065.1 maleylpyruvate isomerase family mycothiol-dependent enzyme [Phycicoccus sonneraticus]